MLFSMMDFIREFIVFGLKQARACVFAGSFFVLLFLSNHVSVPGLARYDFLFIAAVLIQLVLYLTKIETKDEVKTIVLFHLLGLLLELFKTSSLVGSWSYPESAFFKIATVPLFSGFMYAAVGSYIAQSYKINKLRLNNYDFIKPSIILSIFIYLNFFTDTFIYDFRWILIVLVFVLFRKTTVYFTVLKKERKMPLAVGFLLVSLFIWIAENISTFYGAWKYPDQIHVWNVVSTSKISSWFLLVIISFILVANLKRYKAVHGR
jgi:uncharacterized membrane protein YoaT (DUF817 family)